VTQARDQNNKHDKPKARFESLSERVGKIAYAKCLEKDSTEACAILVWRVLLLGAG